VLEEARRVSKLLPENVDVTEFVDLVRQANRLSDE